MAKNIRAHDSSKSESELTHNYCNQPTGEDRCRRGWFSNPHTWGCSASAGSGACVIYSVAFVKQARGGSSPPGSDGADYQFTFMLRQEALIAARERLEAGLPPLLEGGGRCLMAFATASLLINQAAPICVGG